MTKRVEIFRETARRIAERHGLSLVLLFGSVASGSNRPDSDLDIAVRFVDRSCDLRRIVRVQSDFEEALVGLKIDLASIERADPLFLKQIAGNCSTLFERHGETDEFLRLAFKRYQDHAPYLRMERDFIERYAGRIAS